MLRARRFTASALGVGLCLGGCGAPEGPKAAARETVLKLTPPKVVEAPPPRSPDVGAHGEKAAIVDGHVQITLASGATRSVDPMEIHPPPGDRALRGIVATVALFAGDGTLLVGCSDGTVTALDEGYHRRRSTGLRGAIAGLARTEDGHVAATTALGVIASVTSNGAVVWEKQVAAEPLGPPVVVSGQAIVAASPRAVLAVSLGGEALFSQEIPVAAAPPSIAVSGEGEIQVRGGPVVALGEAHTAPPSFAPVFTLGFHRVIEGEVTAVVATGPDEAWALVRKPAAEPVSEMLIPTYYYGHGDEFVDDRYELVHVEGSKITRLPVPHEAAKSEIFLAKTTRKERGAFHLDGLVEGPGRQPWILARRMNSERSGGEDGYVYLRGAGQILEVRGGAVKERDELKSVFFDHILHEPIGAELGGPARLLCFGEDTPACAEIHKEGSRSLGAPGSIVAVTRAGSSDWVLTLKGEVYRREGTTYVTLPAPEGALDPRTGKTSRPLKGIAGVGENDVWGDAAEPYAVRRFDGQVWKTSPLPVEHAEGLFARAADDVWTRNGSAHWDGKRWSRVFGAPAAAAISARSATDVWIAGEGLWHGTATAPVPVQLPAAREVGTATDAPVALLSPGSPASGYVVERARFTLKGGDAVSTARAVSASPEGVIWLQSWSGLVEVEGDKATSLRKARRYDFGRWAVPESAGKGVFLDGAGLRPQGGAAGEEGFLDRHTAVAISGDGHGTLWVAGRATWAAPYDLSPHALVREGGSPSSRPVVGLPAAEWCDVAATADGGAWFAGGLNAGPSGEGILFRARGRLGATDALRFRAAATLLAVSATGDDEAWAAGAGGTIVHVRGTEVTRYALASGEWLRAVFVAAADDVWIGGDGGTLLHHDGQGFHPVAHPLGENASVTGIVAARGVVWAVSPSGILRIKKGS